MVRFGRDLGGSTLDVAGMSRLPGNDVVSSLLTANISSLRIGDQFVERPQ